MTASRQSPDLRGVLNGTLQALARLDVDRLEGIAAGCEDLACDCRLSRQKLPHTICIDGLNMERDIKVFRRLLELTNANLTFTRGLSSMRGGCLEYGRVRVNIPTAEVEYGNH